MTNPLIQEIRDKGFKIHCTHYRHSIKNNAMLPLTFFRLTNSQEDLGPKGGITIMSIKNESGKSYTTLAKCSMSDNFNSRRGFDIALQRLKAVMEKE